MSFTTVLVADRGESAVRVVRAARDAGLRSVAVYVEADIDALHARLADDAYALRGTTSTESYLDITKLLEVAERTGADAVHPGESALAENAEFARAVVAAGVVWVGPDPETIELLGEGSREWVRAVAAEPYGLSERYPTPARHIEVQVLGDRHGSIAVLGTRDCSLRRRGRALVGEAPAPCLEPALRDRLHRAAADVCTTAGYAGAGTVEFLLGGDGALAFLGVTARLQAGSATEMITGVDLVREQFRIAAGEVVRSPAEAPVRGHAIEFHIDAEDPALGFLPTPGAIVRFEESGGPGVRLEPGVVVGQAVPGGFDTLLARLSVWGRSREEALARAGRALAEFEIEGVATTLPFHRRVVSEPAFLAADIALHTDWTEGERSAGLVAAPAVPVPADPGLTRFFVEAGGGRVEVGLPDTLRAQRMPPSDSGAAKRATEDEGKG